VGDRVEATGGRSVPGGSDSSGGGSASGGGPFVREFQSPFGNFRFEMHTGSRGFLHSSTFLLNISASCGTEGAFSGCLGVVWGVLGSIRGCLGLFSVRNGSG